MVMKHTSKPIALFVIIWCLSLAIRGQTFDPLLASALQNKIDSLRNANNLKGVSACVFYPGMGTWNGTAGVSYTANPITSDLLFGIGSNTKLFTGVLLLKLAENGLLTLDDSLHRFLAPIQHVDSNITIRQLLNHTSGLAEVANVPGYSDSMMTDPNRLFTMAETMTWLGPPQFQAGTNWQYCNTNYLLAGLIAENATGQSFSQLLRDSILAPLQLDSTFLDVYESLPHPVAHPWQGGVDNHAVPRTSVNSSAWAAGAMYSTAGEMVQWYKALMHGQVLQSHSFNEMTTFVGSGNYGIGISLQPTPIGRPVWAHGGAIWGGYNSSMIYDPASGIVVCVLVNQLPGTAPQISTQLLSILEQHSLSSGETWESASACVLFPNPSKGFVDLEVPNQIIQEVKIYDLKGHLIRVNQKSPFQVSELSNGTYIIEILTDKGKYTRRLIKH